MAIELLLQGHEVYVITRSNNRSIESEIKKKNKWYKFYIL